jgi:hypothetical protein
VCRRKTPVVANACILQESPMAEGAGLTAKVPAESECLRRFEAYVCRKNRMTQRLHCRSRLPIEVMGTKQGHILGRQPVVLFLDRHAV